MKFIIFSEYGELLDLAMHLRFVEKQDVLMYISEKDYQKIGDGIIDKVTNNEIYDYIGKGYIWVIDGCGNGRFQDYLREQGEPVFGGSEVGDKLENQRQLNQKWFKDAGFKQPYSQNFKNFEEAIKFIGKNKFQRWILKQNGDAPKSLNYMGKLGDSVDMLHHLNELKTSWNEQEYGKVDFDLMEVVEGLEVAASVFFNGKDYLKNKEGKVVGFLNFEEKKEVDGNLGETTGEMGTTFIGVTEDNPLFKDIIMKPKIIEVLRKSKFRGVFDINCIKTKDTVVALEPTCRPGIPATSYEFIEGLDSSTSSMIEAVAKGMDTPVEVVQGVGMVMVIAAKPYPIEVDLSNDATSVGEKLWILRNKKDVKDFSPDQLKHIHLENFEKTTDEKSKEIAYKVATKNGYLLTITGKGKTISDVRASLIQYIKGNIFIAGMKYRTDIGERVEEYYGIKTKSEPAAKTSEEIEKIKSLMKEIIYGSE